MPNKRDLKLDAYNISKFAYRELANFCLQYPEKKRKIAYLHNQLHAISCDGLLHGDSAGDPTAHSAKRVAQLSRDTELIEQTAIDADAAIYQWLLLAVTEDVPWRYLRIMKSLEMCEKTFNERRRQFFYLLARRKNIL